ncbi:Cbl proto-oncoprotein, E3 ubiquitin protein ligase-like 1, variant 4 [Schistosoma haematobium]|nr:Cbl proto-oncoprotein, E3 ubiquitin protein ligase-like 1, variant 4 [Schistosoma haematobium]KAH9588506.1 Cbl proto-oncoprotein, E3 ubiquitin protein ligase-like 1, variant 4 [Schistosoma haematobium]CAH8566031.1 unnamed protein product [Schistosoma haematobium]CAH8571945.1 unnamed protein product [Schistosoma haematobium]
MVCSPGSQRSVSRSTARTHSASRSRSRSGSIRRSYTHSNRSRSGTRSFSRRSSHSRRSTRSKSHSNYSRSHSGSRRSRSWSRSRSRSHGRSAYSSRSRSASRSRSRSYRSRRKSFFRSRTRSCSYHSVRSRSHSPNSRNVSPSAKCVKDPRDRSKRAHWTNNVWLVGEKAKDTVFHFCDICDLPIVIYGRLLPCKHVLCYTCAMNLMKKCNRCQKSIQTVERCLVGGIFMCFESDGCRRTYLSHRDLQAHIDHRHRTGSTVITSVANNSSSNNVNSTMITKNDIVAHSEIITPLPNQVNFTEEASLLSGVVKTITTNANQVTTPLSIDKTTTGAPPPMSLLGPSPRLVMNTMIPPTCGTTQPNIYINNQKNSGLLPLPPAQTSSSTIFSNRLPMGIPRPLRLNNLNSSCSTTTNNNNNSNNTVTNNFPQLQQFTNCPPPTLPPPPSIGAPNIRAPPPGPLQQAPPPSAFLANSLSIPSSSSTQHNQNFSGASAVAALAAVVSAAMSAAAAVQSKSAGMTVVGGTNNLSGATIQQSLTSNQMQPPNPLNASSLITNALRATNPNWNPLATGVSNVLNNSNNNNNNANNSNNNQNNFNSRCLPFQ